MLVGGSMSGKVRVYEVAKQLNLDPKAVVGLFQAIGVVDVRNHMSSVEPEEVERVKRHLEKAADARRGRGADQAHGGEAPGDGQAARRCAIERCLAFGSPVVARARRASRAKRRARPGRPRVVVAAVRDDSALGAERAQWSRRGLAPRS